MKTDIKKDNVKVKDLKVGQVFKLIDPPNGTSNIFMKIDLNDGYIYLNIIDRIYHPMNEYFPSTPTVVLNLTTDGLGVVDAFMDVIQFELVASPQLREL